MATARFFILFYLAAATHATATESQQSTHESRLLALETRLERFESRDLQHQVEIEAMKALERQQQTELDTLRSRDCVQQSEIDNLKTELRLQKESYVTLEKRVNDLAATPASPEVPGEASVDPSAKQHVDDRNDINESVQAEGSMMPSRFRRAESERPTAFYALLNKHALHTGANQNILFENVVTNIGGAYSSSLGAFVAPVPGIYVFSTSIFGFTTQTEHYSLNRNGQTVGRMYGDATKAPYPDQSLTAVLYLHQGDNVEVRTVDADGSAHGSNYSSFAGFLLQQDYDGSMMPSRFRRAESERPTAFYALLNKHALHTGANQNILFENVVTNIGGAYSSSLGAFVAPVTGIYVFSTSILGFTTQTEHYSLNRNGQTVGLMYGDATKAPYPDQSLTAVLYLHQGDNVEVRTLDADGSAHGSNYSAFAGFLLQQDYDSSISAVGK